MEVNFHPLGKSVSGPLGSLISDLAREAGVRIEQACGGHGTCKKCQVQVFKSQGPSHGQDPGQEVLACQTRVYEDLEALTLDPQPMVVAVRGRRKEGDFRPREDIFHPNSPYTYGLAVDIGTTSLAVSVNDMTDGGRELASLGSLNLQLVRGSDIISRINYSHESQARLEEMQGLIVEGLNACISSLSQDLGIKRDHIGQVLVAANTTMLHFLLAQDPIGMAIAPYEAKFLDRQEVLARDLGLDLAPGALVTTLPSISPFVGADIVAGLASMSEDLLGENFLFIDIGTNGEIVLHHQGDFYCTSAAAGPALEGVNISCGKRAEEGALERFAILEGDVVYKTIGGSPCDGICGSGIVDIIAQLVDKGLLNPSGALMTENKAMPRLAQRMVSREGQPAFLIHKENDVYVSQRDVRQVQLAKGAIGAAIRILFKRAEIPEEDLGSFKVYIGGSFGDHLEEASIRKIGLIPDYLTGQVLFLGNTAIEGARQALLDEEVLEDMDDLVKKFQIVELSYAEDFQECFIDELSLG